MNSREQFEAHYDAWTGYGEGSTKLERAKDTYRLPKISTAWIHWQASRAAVVVVAPEKCEHADDGGDYAKGYRQGLRAYRDAIEAAGVKVAP